MTKKVLELISRYTYSVTFGALQRLAYQLEGARQLGQSASICPTDVVIDTVRTDVEMSDMSFPIYGRSEIWRLQPQCLAPSMRRSIWYKLWFTTLSFCSSRRINVKAAKDKDDGFVQSCASLLVVGSDRRLSCVVKGHEVEFYVKEHRKQPFSVRGASIMPAPAWPFVNL